MIRMEHGKIESSEVQTETLEEPSCGFDQRTRFGEDEGSSTNFNTERDLPTKDEDGAAEGGDDIKNGFISRPSWLMDDAYKTPPMFYQNRRAKRREELLSKQEGNASLHVHRKGKNHSPVGDEDLKTTLSRNIEIVKIGPSMKVESTSNRE
ncbi:hypothetical protein KC19_VG297700 [Ceratodon purpureus]|uniref:Uncharacterized protein n=1 Tax=Ceratodon purpureus TaxID=3225 RepID=A0A8T0HVX0_CERPU|nr:hypothetical protein KC19_VG297700 [Ceratodon purpureus]